MIDIIVPSFNDNRILRTITSLFSNASSDKFRLIIIDGGSSDDLVKVIRKNLRSHDICISEADKGIFDALNKGLDIADNDFVYWLGSDDFINPEVDFEKILREFDNQNTVGIIGKTYYFSESRVTRPLHYKKYSLQTYKYGVHVPHFSSIWRRKYLGNLRFDLSYHISADYDYFFKVFKKLETKQVLASDSTLVYMQEGGNSSKDFKRQLEGAKQLFGIHRRHTNAVNAVLFIMARYALKIRLIIFDKGHPPIVDHLTKILLRN